MAKPSFGQPVTDLSWGVPSPGEDGLAEARMHIAAKEAAWRKVDWEEGALALFKVRGAPVHVGTCTATPGIVLHAHSSVGVDLLDVPRSLKWKDRFVGCYLPPE